MNEVNYNSTYQENIQNKIFSEQIKILHKNLLINIPANFICAVAVYIGLYELIKSTVITSWIILVALISVLRLIGFYFFYRRPEYSSLHFYIFIVGVLSSAILWGFADSILMPPNNLLDQMIIIIIVAGITAGGVQTLNANLLASLIHISVIVLPLTIWLFLQNGMTYFALGIAMATYLLFMISVSIRGHRLLERVLTLNYENVALVENLSDSNNKLVKSYKMLEEHEHEITLVNKMNDMLQICQQSTEAYEVIFFTAKELFIGFSGGLAILNPSTNCLETVKQWGDEQTLKPTFTVEDCWALRRGRNYFVNDPANDLICNHFNTQPHAYICLPLILQSGIIGLLVLHPNMKSNLLHYKPQLAISFCEVIQLSLTNIKLRETLYLQSVHDPLTGLFNRRYMDETLIRELQRAIREKKPLCVAMLDLDFFKHFNDTNGHEAGDEILKFIGALFKENFRESDIACRYGGEEFLVVMVNSNLSDAYERLDHIRIALKNEKIHFRDRVLPPITVSIGVAEAPRQGATVNDIIRAADEALYVAKQSGRDRVERFSFVT